MSTFSAQLNKIHQEISIQDSDRKPYTTIFESFTHWLMKEMCFVSPLFEKMYKGTELFGSYSNRVRIIKPKEFDIFILLEFPIPISVKTHSARPGFIEIRGNCWSANETSFQDTFEEMFYGRSKSYTTCLKRTRFQDWIEEIIDYILDNRRLPYEYKIKYNRCSVAHTIKLEERRKPFRRISIDFVPAIKLRANDVLSVLEKGQFPFDVKYLNNFVAIPKPCIGCGPKWSRPYTFQLVNPAAERDLLWDKQNLKVVYRLLKALRNNYKNLRGLKSYFLTAIFLLEVKRRPVEFWRQPVGDIFLHMLSLLIDKYDEEFLPFYWAPSFDLLSILSDEEIEKHGNILTNAYNRLLKISLNKKYVSYSVASHFKRVP